jgi:RHS repeat-associated protein
MLIAGSPLRYEEIIWLDHTPIGRVESSTSAVTAVHVIHSDHLNTPRALANAQTQGGQPAGTVVWRWKLNQQTATGSNAFGAQPAEEDPDGNGTSVRFDLRFPGQQYDAATGLHYNYFRDYEASTGRHIESDPVGLKGGINTFAYVSSQPLTLIDPLGQSPSPVHPTRRRTRPCTGTEYEACAEQCAATGVESCRVSQTWRIVRMKNGLTVWQWADGPMSCSCKEGNFCQRNPVTCGVGLGALVVGICLTPWPDDIFIPVLIGAGAAGS